MTILLTFFTTALLAFINTQWLTELFAPNNLAEIGVVILGMIALSASVQLRSLFEKAQDILRLYAQYTNTNSEEGKKLSPQEKERLLDLFLHELRIVLDQFGGRVFIRVGHFINRITSKLF